MSVAGSVCQCPSGAGDADGLDAARLVDQQHHGHQRRHRSSFARGDALAPSMPCARGFGVVTARAASSECMKKSATIW
jgi:hypothetical protein